MTTRGRGIVRSFNVGGTLTGSLPSLATSRRGYATASFQGCPDSSEQVPSARIQSERVPSARIRSESAVASINWWLRWLRAEGEIAADTKPTSAICGRVAFGRRCSASPTATRG